jgi:DNA-binding beta-propeller fold protein YncE
MAFVSRRNISVADLFPPTSPAVQVVASLPGSLEMGAAKRILSSYFGVLIPSQQYLYVILDAHEEFLLASDFGFFNKKGKLSKIGLDDYAVVSSLEKGSYFGRMAHHEKSNQFVSTVWSTEKGLLYFLDAADMGEIASVGLKFQALMSIAALRGESTLVTSEQGWIAVLDANRSVVRKVQLPVTPQGMSLDRTKNLVAIGSGSGTLVTLNVETLEVLKQRLVSVYSCGVDIDPKGNRIFMPRTLLGDLLVFDEHTLETIARIPLEPGVRVVRYLTDRQIVVVGNYLNGTLYFVDTENYRVIDTVWVGCKIRSIQYAPTRDRLYVSTALRILEVDPNRL